MQRNPFLRVKLKSLAEEARIIKVEEQRANGCRKFELQNSLREHRIGIVRSEARATLLAYQFLRGIPYSVIEKPSKENPPNWHRVDKMVKKYGTNEKFKACHWCQS